MNPERLDITFKAFASAPRREILRILSVSAPLPGKTCCGENEVCACKISDHLGLAPSTVSHHMSVLEKAGLVAARKDGLWVYYTLCHDVLDEAVAELKRL